MCLSFWIRVHFHAAALVATGAYRHRAALSGLLFTEVRPRGTEHAISNFAHTATLAIVLPPA